MVSSEQRRSSQRLLSDEERVLWAGFTGSVVRLRSTAKQPKSEAVEAKTARAIDNLHGVPPRAREAAPPSSLIRRDKQRLARGKQPIDARIDLHGKTRNEAHAALLRFLGRAQANGAKFILVITGKGERPQTRAGEHSTLRREVPLWLGLPEFRSYVSAHSEADATHGGAGALYVRLRRKRPTHSSKE